jgi:exonuclease VII small subunit
MMEFLKKATEWVLDKEEQAAKNCRVDLKDIQKQIDLILEKRAALQKECEENLKELDHILDRLEKIKAQEEACQRK